MKTTPKVTHFRAIVDKMNPRLQPPDKLSDDQKQVWRLTCDALPSNWFGIEQVPMLTSYCQHVCRAELIESALAKLDPLIELESFDKLSKLFCGESAKIAMFARSMRLTQQSRLKAETAQSTGAGAASAARIWQDDDLIAQ